jgi:CRISPR-associated protein Csb2
MSLSITIRFLTGRAHLHPWQTHHSEGRVEWPPSHWRLLRAFVAIAGRGLSTLPYPDEGPPSKPELKATVEGISSLKKRGVTKDAQSKLSLSKASVLSLKEPLTDAEAAAWKLANPSESFSAAIDQVRVLASAPELIALADVEGDGIPISHLAQLLATLAATPSIWLPKTAGGHTRQYFPIHDAGIVKNSGSAVFDTFATVCKDQPLVFHWPNVDLDAQSAADLKLILGRLTYFGRAESWCRAEVHSSQLKDIPNVVPQGDGRTHWECVCIEDGGNPVGKEYRDYTLERRLAACGDVKSEAVSLLPRTKIIATDSRPKAEEDFRAILNAEQAELSLLRCLLRESGQDIKDGLERPVGTRWVHYAVPRTIYDVPRPFPQPKPRNPEAVDLVVYALNTATVHRPVLPALSDTLLVADRFRSAAMALARNPGHALSGHKENGDYCREHAHAFWWPTDEDNDGFLDHVTVYACGGFERHEADALRRLTRIRQRGGRPDLLVTPIYVGRENDYKPWQQIGQGTNLFVSATPYYCPVSLSRGRNSRASRPHSIKKDIRKRLRQQQLIELDDDVEIQELVFDYAPSELEAVQRAVAQGEIHPPIPPRQYFPLIDPPIEYPELPKLVSPVVHNHRYEGSIQKDPDAPFTFGLSSGLYVDEGMRFVRSLSFCRLRRNHELRGPGRMFCLIFRNKRSRRPFAIGDQCHFGLGLFIPENEKEAQMT